MRSTRGREKETVMSVHSQAELEDRLWKEIEKARYGMLGVVGRVPAGHFQPMTAFCERDSGQIWFFSRSDTDLAQAVAQDVPAMFIIQAKDQGFQACIGGRLVQRFDAERMQSYWGPVVAAWYPEGQNDPRLTMLCFEVHDAQVWLSETNPLAFGFQIVKANMTGREPDVGESRPVNLDHRP
jgi:general stress protein 26